MNPDFEVDTDELRRAASALAETAARVSAATSETPTIPRVPRWLTTDAGQLAAEAARQQLAVLGGDVEETVRRIKSAAQAYEAADTRTAARLRSTR